MNHQQQDLIFEHETLLQMYNNNNSSTECEESLLHFSGDADDDTQGLLLKRVESYLSSGGGSSWYKKLKVDKDMESLDSFGIEVSGSDDDDKSDCSFSNRYEESLNWEVDNFEESFEIVKEKPICNKFSPLLLRRCYGQDALDYQLEYLDPPCFEASSIGCSSLESKTLIVSSLYIQDDTHQQQHDSPCTTPLNNNDHVISYSTMDSTNRVLLVHSKLEFNKEQDCECLIRLALLSSSILYIVVNREVEDVVAHQIIFKILKIATSLNDAFKSSSNRSLIRIPDIRVLYCKSDFLLDQGLSNRVETLNFGENFVWDEWITDTSPVVKQLIEGCLKELESEQHNSLKLFNMASNYVTDYFGNFNSIYSLISSFTTFDLTENTDKIIAQTAITTAKILNKTRELSTKKDIENRATLSKIENESKCIIRKKNKEIEKLKKQLNEFKKSFYSTTVDLQGKPEKKNETRVIDLSSNLILGGGGGGSSIGCSNRIIETTNIIEENNPTRAKLFFHPYVYVLDKFKIYDELRKSKLYRMKRYKDGSSYEGEYRNHMRQGLGTFLSENGNIYTGSWNENDRHGYGMQEYSSEGTKYCGQWRNDVKHGYGTSWYKDGGIFTGEYLDGLRTGMGIYTYPSGNQYDGQWKNGVRNGFGIYRYCSGEEYYGDWVDDLRSGFGTYIGSDESKYEGEWLNGLKHGEGTLATMGDDEIYKGSFVAGKKHGKGKIIFKSCVNGEDPLSFEGSFSEDEMEGEGRYCLKSGDVLHVIVSPRGGIVKIITREVCKFKQQLLLCLKRRTIASSSCNNRHNFTDVIILIKFVNE